jgi:cephalosporin hydroxylase
MSDLLAFQNEVQANIAALGRNERAKALSIEWLRCVAEDKYSYNFSWMGVPIIQFPQDIVAMQELLWRVKPDLVIETGVARGGSVIFYASMLELIGKGEVLGIDIDIRSHNREAIESHPMHKRISLLEGSSISDETAERVKAVASKAETVLVVLDSNHTHEHVLRELELYAPLVSPGSYCVVFDTVVEDVPDEDFPDRPWGKGNNPKTAVWAFLEANRHFEIDVDIHNKLQVTVAPDGYLKRIETD